MEPTQAEIDEEFSYLFWHYLWAGYSRENAVKKAAREVMSALQDMRELRALRQHQTPID